MVIAIRGHESGAMKIILRWRWVLVVPTGLLMEAATRREKKPCSMKPDENRLDSDRPSHGRRCRNLALFLRQNRQLVKLRYFASWRVARCSATIF